jgi:hypothetical protein
METKDPHVVLNGLGMNLKTALLAPLSEYSGLGILESDSFVIKKLEDTISDPKIRTYLNRAILRYGEIQMLGRATIIDRSLIDQMIIAKFLDEGLIDPFPGYDPSSILEYWDDYLKLELELNCNRVVFSNYDTKMIEELISDPEFSKSKRKKMYKSVDDYFRLQEYYLDIYKKNISECIEISLPEKFTTYGGRIEYLKLRTIYEIFEKK